MPDGSRCTAPRCSVQSWLQSEDKPVAGGTDVAFVLIGINAVGEHLSSGLMTLPSLLETDLGIHAESHLLLFAGEPELESPVFAASCPASFHARRCLPHGY